MYTSFFGLNEKPFSITPDPRYLYMSERHAEALAHLIYGVKESGGFIQLTGEVGTGKTTLVRSLLQQLPDFADVAVVLNSQLSRVEFLTSICEELHIAVPEQRNSIKALTDALNVFLLRNHSLGRRTILIVDEAQNLRVDVLEQVRLLTNLETAKQKLLQIILIGQPELREVLERNDMRQLAQRITGRYHLEPLTRDETAAYVDHRLRVAGAIGQIFSVPAKRELFRLSGGVPRMINVIADRALLGAFTIEQHQLTPELVRAAAAEVFDRPSGSFAPWRRRWRARPAELVGLVATGLVIVLAAAFAGFQWQRASLDRQPHSAPVLAATTPEPELPAMTSEPELPTTTPVIVDDTEPAIPLAPLLKANGSKTGTDTAFATLFRFWNVDLRNDARRPCVQAEELGLNCLYRRGTIDEVRALGRPVILTLRDASDDPHQVVLAGLGLQTASIDIDGTAFRVASSELQELWFGEYLLLWRPGTSMVKSFLPGMRDPDVLWLRQSLARIQGKPVEPMDSDVYDDNLAARVRLYQRTRRLPIDGIAGHVTQAAINSELGDGDMPRLALAN
ncbi:MAG: AAA family ATPase [Gammaproteobacteria bacterium]|nr:AAA family ATPase [Gammaproteobacteria bacterium]MDH5275855.1 AAA family ATPase [Gammaproteobacteria bacterium]